MWSTGRYPQEFRHRKRRRTQEEGTQRIPVRPPTPPPRLRLGLSSVFGSLAGFREETVEDRRGSKFPSLEEILKIWHSKRNTEVLVWSPENRFLWLSGGTFSILKILVLKGFLGYWLFCRLPGWSVRPKTGGKISGRGCVVFCKFLVVRNLLFWLLLLSGFVGLFVFFFEPFLS